jgi:hypothetical protein
MLSMKEYLGEHPSYKGIYRVTMTAKLWWADDQFDGNPDVITPEFNMDELDKSDNPFWGNEFFKGRELTYELWLDGPIEFDSSGNILKSGEILVFQKNGRYVGGVWKNGSDKMALVESHPDYMWMPYGVQYPRYNPDIILWDKNPRIDDTWVRKNIANPIRN